MRPTTCCYYPLAFNPDNVFFPTIDSSCNGILRELEKQFPSIKKGGGQRQMIYEDNIHHITHELHMDNKKQFLNYIKCPYSYSEYIRDLRRKNII